MLLEKEKMSIVHVYIEWEVKAYDTKILVHPKQLFLSKEVKYICYKKYFVVLGYVDSEIQLCVLVLQIPSYMHVTYKKVSICTLCLKND